MKAEKKSIDVLVYVALTEEFQYVVECLDIDLESKESDVVAVTYYLGSIFSSFENKEITIALIPSGRMGNTRSSTIMSLFIEKMNPKNVVVLGIAGAIDNDLTPGDVFIPDSVIEYLANSAGVQKEGIESEWEFKLSGNSFYSTPRLINRYQNFPHTKSTYYQDLRKEIEANNNELISEEIIKSLEENEVIIDVKGGIIVGDDKILASGPTVGKGLDFSKWLKVHNRKVVAIEMETAGVYEAVFARVESPRVIALRGISDFADERKHRMEKIASTSFRKLAIKNSISLLKSSIRGGLFAPEKKKIVT